MSDNDELDDEFDDATSDTIYLKYMFEGAATVAELSTALRRLADEIDRQGASGWRLAAPVDNGYAHLTRDVGC